MIAVLVHSEGISRKPGRDFVLSIVHCAAMICRNLGFQALVRETGPGDGGLGSVGRDKGGEFPMLKSTGLPEREVSQAKVCANPQFQ